MFSRVLAFAGVAFICSAASCGSIELKAQSGSDPSFDDQFVSSVIGLKVFNFDSMQPGTILTQGFDTGIPFDGGIFSTAHINVLTGSWEDNGHLASVQSVPSFDPPGNQSVHGVGIINGLTGSPQTFPVLYLYFSNPSVHAVGFWLFSEIPDSKFEIYAQADLGSASALIDAPDGPLGTVEGYVSVRSCSPIQWVAISLNCGGCQGDVGVFGIDSLQIGFLSALIPGDITWDGRVNALDLSIILANWGPACDDPYGGVGDFNGDGQINSPDLAWVLGNWTD
jgi:hypothetical protein